MMEFTMDEIWMLLFALDTKISQTLNQIYEYESDESTKFIADDMQDDLKNLTSARDKVREEFYKRRREMKNPQ